VHTSVRRENGSILILTAVMLSVLLGITALAVDVGALYDTRNGIAAAADAAAYAAALEQKRALCSGNCDTLTNFGRDASKQSGFENSVGGVSVAIAHPPTAGPFLNDTNYVEAIVSQPVPTHFLRVFGRASMPVAARAVARWGQTPTLPCMTALDNLYGGISTASALQFTGGTVNALNCTVASRSGISTSGSGKIDVRTDGIFKATSYTGSGFLPNTVAAKTIVTAASTGDLFSSLVPLPIELPCTPSPAITANMILDPHTYCNGLRINKAGVKLRHGNYVMNGGDGFTVSAGGDVSAFDSGGVLIYVNAGPLAISDTVTLSAALSGDYAGVLFWQPKTNTTDARVSAGATGKFGGAFYVPFAALSFTAGSATVCQPNDYTFLLAKTLVFSGGANYCNNLPVGLSGGVFQTTTALAE
jgi:hypothetical protein